jgi:electron transport complex protein RnfG
MTAKDMAKITINLVIIYLVGGFLLAFVYAKTSPVIFINNKIAKEKALKEMVPEAESIDKIGDWHPHEKHAEYFVARTCGEVKVHQIKNEKTGEMKEEKECVDPTDIGYVVQTFGKGYSSYIDILFSVDKDYKVKKISILHHAETPGLGDEIELDYFKDMFAGKDKDHLKVLKTETTEYIQAITGATISTRAVSEDGIQKGLEFLISALEEGHKREVKHE